MGRCVWGWMPRKNIHMEDGWHFTVNRSLIISHLGIVLVLDNVHGVLADVDDRCLDLGVGEPTGQLGVGHDLADDILGLEAQLVKLMMRASKHGFGRNMQGDGHR